MIVESAQMLSTAHRIIDGNQILENRTSTSGKIRTIKTWKHADDIMDKTLYRAAYINHPCGRWTRQTRENYEWHQRLFISLCDEYRYRYGRIHMTDDKLRSILTQAPQRIPDGSLTPFPLAMKSNPECMDVTNPIESYRKFYQTKQHRFKMKWTRRSIPEWFVYK